MAEPNLTISVREFLAMSNWSNRPALVALPSDSTVKDALDALSTHNILSIPVVVPTDPHPDPSVPDFSGQYLGTVDAGQLLLHLMRLVRSTSEPQVEAVAAEANVQEWELLQEAVNKLFSMRLVDLCGNDTAILFQHWLDKSVMELVQGGFLKAEDAGVVWRDMSPAHRVVLCTEQSRIDMVISQSDVVRFLAEHPSCFEPGVLDKSLEELNFLAAAPEVIPEVVAVAQSVTAIAAFALMEAKGVSGLAVLGAEGALVGSVSASDLRGMGQGEFGLLMSVEDFMLVNKEEVACHAVLPSDTFDCLLQTFKEKRVHRMYVVNEEHSPVAVITLTDILRFLSRACLASQQ
eukprot:TRINITY_DN7239_c0_g2_i4.p1 TRINITY_DN7239_c0_g2~~TRINITY_DN7239_c0_g2_i4.p1  ORF type:complete len:348 (+),score=85.70 TRINITY_DN7239_c0_g2_i4:136-1179(+)